MTARYRSKASKLVDSLINYTLDIKPYHTKLKQFISELYFNDVVNVSFIGESFNPIIYLQNVWTKDDIGALYLQSLSEGTEQDRHMPLPPAAYPRFSLNSFLDYGQTPPGDDPATLEFLDANVNGVPDAEEPWTGDPSASHQLGVFNEEPVSLQAGFASIVSITSTPSGGGFNYTATLDVPVETDWTGFFGISTVTLTLIINGQTASATQVSPGVWRVVGITGFFDNADVYGGDVTALFAFIETTNVQAFATADTGRYQVPFHHGSYVTVDGVRQLFSIDYVVDSTRGFIQFLAGHHPTNGQLVTINYFNSDRVFISLQDPLNFGEAGYDVTPYDDVPYDYPDDAYDSWGLVVDSASPNGYNLSFNNTQPGTAKAYIGEVIIYPSENDGNTWLIKASGYQSVTVQQILPITGPIEHAAINIPFDNGKIAFKFKNTWLDYYFVQDSDSYIAYDISMFELEHYGEPLDSADFWPSLELKTEHGVIADPVSPLHAPVEFIGIFQSSNIAGYDLVPYDLDEYDADGNVSEYIRPLGVIRQVQVSTLQGLKPTYEFYFDRIPVRGTYIEIRVEQARQYNPRVNVSILDVFGFTEITDVIGPGPGPGSTIRALNNLLGAGILGTGLLGHGYTVGSSPSPSPSGSSGSVLGSNILGSSLVD